MVFQISVGDAILLAQIAWQLGQTFTKGRSSAPTEFKEVESELYSLSAALTAAESEQKSLRSSNGLANGSNQLMASQDVFEHIIQNCKHTLAHLEEIVQKYMIVTEQTDPQKPKFERWSHSIIKNWRKVEWTTEKGDLNMLRSQLMLHTNSLNLFINIGTSSRAASIEQSLNEKLVLLEELHQWYVNNLKESKPNHQGVPTRTEMTIDAQSDIVSTFELKKKTTSNDEVVCPTASFRSEWLESFQDETLDPSSGSMFVCNCSSRDFGALPHEANVQRYGLSHLIFPLRVAGDDGSWMLYKTADKITNQLIDLYIRRISPKYLRHLEDTFFRSLSSRRGEAILAQGSGNSLCYIATDTLEEHVLEAISDLKIAQTSVESITFHSGRTQHVEEWVTDIQILQYGVRDAAIPIDNIQAGVLRSLDYAEIFVSFDADECKERDDLVSMVLKLRRSTVVVLTEKASLEIKSIDTVGTHSDERTKAHDGLQVTIQFTTKSAAKEFYEKVGSMRKDLFVRSLQYPRPNEKVLLSLQAAKVECESLYIDDAEITIVVDTNSRYRLIIASSNGRTIISQHLVEDFFTASPNKPNFTGSTYVVQIGETGEREVYHYKKGFRHLNLSTAQANRMLELARSSVSFDIRNREDCREGAL
ncbi:hypothetical protein F5B22DRAFT_635722 [Xylaria bambusicola]|uniref:uncharacterized protein n=1 Tax=Xylaria bambusicola TaxID=326684 RepID=UPI002008E0F2|nr:uncharacterized protein F5B22DRAFT_635722 [Xylaria bambusicola]KAI0517877.1 hypothetical protein F5B22DRAFT_635722 [Xylaria bambusicola]